MLYNGGESLVDVLDGEPPPPLPPKTERPPLPPKQRSSSRRSMEPQSPAFFDHPANTAASTGDSSDDQTYVNSADIITRVSTTAAVGTPGSNRRLSSGGSGGRTKLSINSPSPTTMLHHHHISAHNNTSENPISLDNSSSQFVYGSYYSSGTAAVGGVLSQDSSTRVSVPVIQQGGGVANSGNDMFDERNCSTPPILPPKDCSTPVDSCSGTGKDYDYIKKIAIAYSLIY